MLQNEPLKYCFDKSAHLFAQAAVSVLNTCLGINGDNPAEWDIEELLAAKRADVGQYFKAGTDINTVRAAVTEATERLNELTQIAADTSGRPKPTTFPPYNLTTTEPLNGEQAAILNTCIEFIRVTVGSVNWLLELAGREKYERETVRAIKKFGREVQPYTAADEMEAAAALVMIAEKCEQIRAALNVPEYPKLDGKQGNQQLDYWGNILWQLWTGLGPKFAAEIIRENWTFLPPKSVFDGWDFLNDYF